MHTSFFYSSHSYSFFSTPNHFFVTIRKLVAWFAAHQQAPSECLTSNCSSPCLIHANGDDFLNLELSFFTLPSPLCFLLKRFPCFFFVADVFFLTRREVSLRRLISIYFSLFLCSPRIFPCLQVLGTGERESWIWFHEFLFKMSKWYIARHLVDCASVPEEKWSCFACAYTAGLQVILLNCNLRRLSK